jgi:hypothetical protein
MQITKNKKEQIIAGLINSIVGNDQTKRILEIIRLRIIIS